jgi:two-component system chemotaxis sensor kinase CheA
MLAQTASQLDPVLYEKLLNGMSHLERNTRDLQEAVMSIRMVPIGFVFSRFPRVVRDLAAKLDKQVDLKTIGEGTELDRGLIEKVVDPLTHLVRNSLDHGIEHPEARIAAGKPARGTITLRASHQGGSIIIEVSDDGAGLDREKILVKARERGLAAGDALTDQEVWQFIFDAGFSTAASVTDVSGRGVGMDVVRRNIQGLGGRVDIDSTKGQGTRITIRLPLTLAILDGMSIALGDEIFIIPLTYIVECLRPRARDVKTVGGRGLVVQVRGEYLPVLPLSSVFDIPCSSASLEHGIMVIMEAASGKTALLVDALLGQHQVVIKNLESNYRKVRGISGATIMGDGKVALILDVDALVDMAGAMNVAVLEAA